MADKTQIKVGQTVRATFAWTENEQPTARNFFTGKVTQIVERSAHAVYVRLQGLERIVPLDRVQAI